MKISSIELAGFRGIKERIEVSLPSGFAVITGRNGSGKSTLCDAIEFVLTGTLDKYSSSKDDLESVEDYLWWRGEGKPKDRYVRVGFTDQDGKERTRERRPGQRSGDGEDEQFFRDICGPLTEGEGFASLIKTTIVRDETIARLGLDMTGTQRFAFTKTALGVSDFTRLEKRAGNSISIIEKRRESAESEYRAARTRVNDLISSASEVRVQVSESGDIDAAERLLRDLVSRPSAPVTEVLAASREELRQLRWAVEYGPRLLKDLKDLEEFVAEIATPGFVLRGRQAESLVGELEISLQKILEEKNALDAELAKFRDMQPRLSDLAQLHELGERLGLERGLCPLCGSNVSLESLSENISKTKGQIHQHSTQLNGLVQRLGQLREQEGMVSEQLRKAHAEVKELVEAKNRAATQRADLTSEANKSGYAISKEPSAITALEHEIETKRTRLSQVERALGTVEATRLLEKLADLERQTGIARKESEAAEKQLKKLESLLSNTKSVRADVQRFAGEIVDERLAELTPLLGELFIRLKPHLSWPQLHYRLRGEVQHFLSLQVGENLNPKFFFSSGQRRAAGLAFLLAVHLSRPWCSLNTLILDDPVQHIDDYRALHLVEVLSAIRQGGEQVICTAEDEELGQFLCRRLRCSELGEGVSVEMEYSLDRGVRIAKETKVYPLPQEVLFSSKAS